MKSAARLPITEPVSEPISDPVNDNVTQEVVRFLGLDFHPMTVEAAAAKLDYETMLVKPFSYIVTPNVDHMVRLEREPAIRPLYDEASLILNDSRVLELLARGDGHKFPASPGADIVQHLFENKIDPNEAVVVIGSNAEDVQSLKDRFGLKDVRWHDAPMGLKKNPRAVAECAAFMAKNRARFHFICVGAPQQEMVAWAASQRGDVTGIGLCCGASLDFLSGKTKRAPKWMRQSRLEWLHRLCSEPRRLAKRYMVDGPEILKIWRRHRKQKLVTQNR